MTYYPTAFITLNQLIVQYALSTSAATSVSATTQAVIDALDTVQRTQLKQLIFDVSDELIQKWHRIFLPFQATFTIQSTGSTWRKSWYQQGGGLFFSLERLNYADCLSLSSVSLNAVVQSASDYSLSPDGLLPATEILFNAANVSLPAQVYGTTLELTGLWGYHENPDVMWVANGALLAGISDTATSFTATTGTIEVYQYLRIGTEYLFVTNVTVGAPDTITVERGVRGTTAAAHLISVAIYKYAQMPVILKAVRRRCVNLMQKMPELANLVQIGEGVAQASTESFDLPDNLKRDFWGSF